MLLENAQTRKDSGEGEARGAFCSFVLRAELGVSCVLATHLLQMSEWLSLH